MTPETTPLLTGLKDQIRAIKSNDEKAIKALYTENFRRVEKYVQENNGSSDEAKDVYQEAFIAVWRNIQLDRFEPRSKESLNAYLYQVARNKWLDHLRSGGYRNFKTLKTDDDLVAEISPEPTEEQEKIDSIKKNFEELGEMCRDVLTRFYYKKESLRTISLALSWTEATARNNKYRCLQRLRELFKKNK